MTCRANSRRLAAGILAFVLFYVHSSVFAAAGRTLGSFQVSATGAATYTIPIIAPRGPNGLQPQIALAYNSQSGNGYLGVGWALSGLSSIYRCKQTFAQDPDAAPVTLTMSDVFCMDGQRLRLTTSGGTYGDPGTTYQTEVANFSNVTAYGSAGNGPAYFEVQGRNGRTYEYGNTADSQVQENGTAWVWYLDKVTDRAGSTMTLSYCTDDTDGNPNSFCTQSGATASGTAVPVTISWTPSIHGASSYNYTMQFAYSTNVPQGSVYGYVGGAPYSETNLLTSISVSYTGTTVKKYVLTYAQSSTTARDTLATLQECADAGATNCLPATTFTYQSGQIGVSTNSETAISNVFTEVAAHNDFNGDGINDLAYCSGTPSMIYVAFGSSSGYGTPVNTNIACTISPVYADLDAGGRDGIFVPNGTDWWYYTWNGSSFSGQDTTLQYDSTASQYVVADVNGDGYPDLVSLYHTSGTWYIDVRLNISAANISTCVSSAVCFSDSNNEWYGPVSDSQTFLFLTANTDGSDSYGTLKGLDFNGDGRQDLSLQVLNSGTTVITYELLSGTSSFTAIDITMASARARNPTTFLNFNSDGCTDYAFNGVIYISGCNGTVPQQIGLNGATIVGAMDWDGDGYTDILVANGSTIGIYLSEGNGISTLQTTSIPYDSSDIYFAFDADGDGLDDLGVYSGDGVITYYLHNAAGEKPDLLTTVTDGFGNFSKPAYVSLPQGTGSTYTPGIPIQLSDRVGYAEYTDPLYVVRSVTYSDPTDPSNSTYTRTYSYSDAIKDIQGIGFVGFATKMAADSRTGVYETFGYYQVFPDDGMLQSDVATQSNTPQKTIFDRSYSISNYVLDGSEYNLRTFPVVDTTDEEYEVGGPEDGQLIRTITTSNHSPDNYGNPLVIVTTVTDNDPASPYVNDSWTTKVTNAFDPDQSTWCLTLLSQSQVLYSASDGSTSVTRTRDYTSDSANCRYTQITTEPSSNTYKVIETLGYDNFGNINSDTVVGAGMTARQTTASWGTTGQFPMSATDSGGAQTQFNYDFRYGLLSSETDPNGPTTSWVYGDGFDRVTQETRPDGTYTKYYYSACSSSNNYCGNSDKPDLRLFLQKQFFGSDGSLIVERDLYENSADAVRMNSIYNLSGKVYISTSYDSLGRVIEHSVPHFTTEYDTTYSYDVLNRVVQTQRPTNQNDSTPQTTSYAYQGDTTTITDPYSNTRTLVRDPNGWLRETTDALGYAVFLGYDAAGSKSSVSDNLNNGPSKPLWTGAYAYGVAPFLIGETDVDRGTWGYTVDALGERTAWTDPKGQQFFVSYDALSRPVTRTEPDLFTQWTWGFSAASHNIGQLANVCTGTGSACSSSFYSENDTYDGLGRMYQRAIAAPGLGTYTYTWLYNSTTGFLDTLTYPVSTSGQALELKYAYHTGLLQSITDVLDSPNVTIWQADAQNAYNQPSEETFGNGLVISRAYDAVTDWLASVQSGPGGGASVQNQSFLYDEIGNVTQRQDNNRGLTENFYYDGDYRLSYSTMNGTQNLSLNYDQTGNITSRSDVASGATWTYDALHVHEVTQAGSSAYNYAYDANGNATSRQGSSITWTSYNYPATVSDSATGETVSFSYGPDRRAWLEETQSPSGTELNYRVGGLLDIVSSGGVTDYRHYIYAGSEPVAIDSRKSNGTNTFSYLLSDQEGSIADITNNSGGVVVGEGFTAYGSRRNPTTWSGAPSSSDLTTIAGITRHGYTFQEALGEMGLNDMVGRVQDAITGRFLSADPTIPHPMSAQSYNRYSYAENNPLTYIDPTGFAGCVPVTEGQLPYMTGDPPLPFSTVPTPALCSVDAPPEPPGPTLVPINLPSAPPPPVLPNFPGVPGGPGPGQGQPGVTQSNPQPSKPQQSKPPQKTPCDGVAGTVQDFTGGQSSQSFIDDTVNNFVDTKGSGFNTVLEGGASMFGGGTVAGAWGGVTPLQAAAAAWATYQSDVSIPGLIGFRTVPQLLFTTGVTWATNALLIKGMYNSGVLVGSGLRTAANRAASAVCSAEGH